MANDIKAEPTSQTAELKLRDLQLMALTVSSGAVDAISFIALGKVFTAFMTGNIAFLGLGLAGAGGPGILPVLVSMGAFVVGVFLSSRIVKPPVAAGPWPRHVTIALALALIPQAAFLLLWLQTGGVPSSANIAMVLLGLWALPMGMQTAAVQRLKIEGVFTTAATATIMYLVEDVSNSLATAADRRRLAGVIASLFVGASLGGLMLVYAHIYAPILPLLINVAVVAAAEISHAVRNNPSAARPHFN